MRWRFLYCSFFVLGFFLLMLEQSHAAPRARILDAKGKLITTVPTLWLDREHLAIPATAYRHLGLTVSYAKKERRVYISLYESCTTVGLRAGAHRGYHPDMGYWPLRSPYPIALKRNGHFYVSVQRIDDGFDTFTTFWDTATRQLTLKRHSDKWAAF